MFAAGDGMPQAQTFVATSSGPVVPTLSGHLIPSHSVPQIRAPPLGLSSGRASTPQHNNVVRVASVPTPSAPSAPLQRTQTPDGTRLGLPLRGTYTPRMPVNVQQSLVSSTQATPPRTLPTAHGASSSTSIQIPMAASSPIPASAMQVLESKFKEIVEAHVQELLTTLEASLDSHHADLCGRMAQLECRGPTTAFEENRLAQEPANISNVASSASAPHVELEELRHQVSSLRQQVASLSEEMDRHRWDVQSSHETAEQQRRQHFAELAERHFAQSSRDASEQHVALRDSLRADIDLLKADGERLRAELSVDSSRAMEAKRMTEDMQRLDNALDNLRSDVVRLGKEAAPNSTLPDAFSSPVRRELQAFADGAGQAATAQGRAEMEALRAELWEKLHGEVAPRLSAELHHASAERLRVGLQDVESESRKRFEAQRAELANLSGAIAALQRSSAAAPEPQGSIHNEASVNASQLLVVLRQRVTSLVQRLGSLRKTADVNPEAEKVLLGVGRCEGELDVLEQVMNCGDWNRLSDVRVEMSEANQLLRNLQERSESLVDGIQERLRSSPGGHPQLKDMSNDILRWKRDFDELQQANGNLRDMTETLLGEAGLDAFLEEGRPLDEEERRCLEALLAMAGHSARENGDRPMVASPNLPEGDESPARIFERLHADASVLLQLQASKAWAAKNEAGKGITPLDDCVTDSWIDALDYRPFAIAEEPKREAQALQAEYGTEGSGSPTPRACLALVRHALGQDASGTPTRRHTGQSM